MQFSWQALWQATPRRTVYRVAVFGNSAAGKTVLLAALAAPHGSHPKGYTSTRLPLDFAIPAGGPEQLPVERQRNLARGQQWLDQAIEHLKKSDVPPPTALSAGHMLFDFEFTDPAHNRTFKVELIDYAGELINPKQTATENAQRLRKLLKHMDALLVLAPAPHPEGWGENLDEELQRLREAFSLVRGERQTGAVLELPIALLISKWDRYSDWSGQPDRAVENRKLQEFLGKQPAPPHRALYDALKGSVIEGYTAAFPVSAFGSHERVLVDNRWVERPKQISPLQSFGLEDPFIWVLEKHDELSLKQAQEALVGFDQVAQQWLKWLLPWPVSAWQLWQRAKQMQLRFAKHSAEHQRAGKIHWHSGLILAARSGSLAILVVIALLTTEMVADNGRYRSLQTVFSDPRSSSQAIDAGEQWLLSYYVSPFYRHRLAKLLLLSSTQAKEQLDGLRELRQETLWQGINNIGNLEERLRVAEEYRRSYPNGTHINEIQKIYSDLQREQEDRTWKLAEQGSGEAQVAAARAYFQQYPAGRYAVLASNLISEAEAQKSWAEFAVGIEQTLRSQQPADLLQAAVSLSRRQADPRTQTAQQSLEQQVRAAFAATLQADLESFLNQGKGDEAISRLESYQRQWPSGWDAPNWSSLEQNLKTSHDQYLYRQVAQHATEENCRNYLEHAPLGTMHSDVQRSLDYLTANKSELPLTVTVASIQVGKRQGLYMFSHNYHYEVAVAGKTVVDKDISEGDGRVVPVNQHTPLRAKRSDAITLSVSVVDPGTREDTIHSERKAVKVTELEGYTLKAGGGHQVRFSLSGLPSAPTLPSWRQ